MPFVTQERRYRIKGSLEETQPGDRCYVFYNEMVEKWKAEPRWTTAHNIYRGVILSGTQFGVTEDALAHELAWQVFFQLHVIPYELRKREENGDI